MKSPHTSVHCPESHACSDSPLSSKTVRQQTHRKNASHHVLIRRAKYFTLHRYWRICKTPRLVLVGAMLILAAWSMARMHGKGSTQWHRMNVDSDVCVSWRSTDWCHPNGKHLPDRDVPCHEQVPQSAGYCECAGGFTIAHVSCGHHKFTCADKCSELAYDKRLGRPPPRLMGCSVYTHSYAATVRAAFMQAILAKEHHHRHKGRDRQLVADNINSLSPSSSQGGASNGAHAQKMSTEQQTGLKGAANTNGVSAPASRSIDGNLVTKLSNAGGYTASRSEQEDDYTHRNPPPTEALSIPFAALLPEAPSQYANMNMGTLAEVIHKFDKKVRMVWDNVGGLVRHHAHREDVGLLPSIRTQHKDWVMDGVRLAPQSVGEMRANVRQLKQAIPTYPTALFSGRGVVMIAGGMKYMVSAWVGLHMLRRAGCRLPVEMWFPIIELPTPELEAELHALGAIVRTFDQRDLDQSGFTLKVTAMVLSSFQEVVFLDADNFSVRDPAQLFDSPEYNATGALFWQDFWDASAAPEVHDILEIPPSLRPTWSHESGQMVVDKERHWRGLLLCIYLNYYHELYYELLTGFMGKGDKETFAYAMLAVGEPVHIVSRPTEALGLRRARCELRRGGRLDCEPLFATNTMVQRDEGGSVFFLHSNLNKWTLDLPDSFDDYTRRWQVMAGHDGRPMQPFPEWAVQQLGFDVEHEVYEMVRKLRCTSWFDEWYRMRTRRGDTPVAPMKGLHEMVEGMHLLDWYRFGLHGSYANMLQRSWHDELVHFWNGHIKLAFRATRSRLQFWLSGNGSLGGWSFKQMAKKMRAE